MVLKREEVIKRLLAGEELIELVWGGPSYRMGKDTVRTDTAEYLEREGLVERSRDKGLHQSYRATEKLKASNGVALKGDEHALF